MRKHLFKRLLVIISIVFIAFMAAAPATAATVTTPKAATTSAQHVHASASGYATLLHPVTSIVADGGPPASTPDAFTDYLPVVRWNGAASVLHGRFDQFLQTNVIAYSQRTALQQMFLMAGNGLYQVNTQFLNFAINVSVLDQVGATADKAAASIGKTLLNNSPIVVGIIAVALGMLVFRVLRRGLAGAGKKLLVIAGVVALFALMVTGAGASATVNGKFQPGFGSPGWFATKVNDTVSSLASAPVAGLLGDNSPVKLGSPTAAAVSADTGGPCGAYMQNLRTENAAQFKTASSSIPAIMSSLWEGTGLTVWKNAQYGTSADGSASLFADNVYCHQLEWQANIPPQEQVDRAAASLGYNPNDANPKSKAWGTTDNNDADRSLIAWAACQWQGKNNFTVTPDFAVKADNSPWITPSDCQSWWTGDQNTDLSAFNVGGADSDIQTYASTDDVTNFLKDLHGSDNTAGLFQIIVYDISAVAMLVIFGLLSIAVLLAKFSSVVMMMAVFVVLLATIFTREGTNSRLMHFVKSYVGFSVLAFGASLLLAVITMLSRVVSSVGDSTFGPGSLMGLLWTGAAPIIACVLLHLVMTKMFKLPTVFKPSGALAWGQAAGGGAIGGAVGGFIAGRESRAGRLASRAGKHGLHTASGGRLGTHWNKGAAGHVQRPGMMGTGAAAGVAAGVTAGKGATAAVNKRMGTEDAAAAKLEQRAANLHAKGKSYEHLLEPNQPTRVVSAAQRAWAGSAGARQALLTPEGRKALRENSNSVVNRAHGRMQTGLDRVKQVATALRDNPEEAIRSGMFNAALRAERAPGAIKDAYLRAEDRTLSAINNVPGRAKEYARNNIGRMEGPVKAFAKVGGAAVLGTIVAGPAGGAVAAGMATRHTVKQVQGKRLSAAEERVEAFRAHMAKKDQTPARQTKPQPQPQPTPHTPGAGNSSAGGE